MNTAIYQILKTLNEFYDYAAERRRSQTESSVDHGEDNSIEGSKDKSTIVEDEEEGTVDEDGVSMNSDSGYWSRLCANEAEFRGYYALCQLYNPAEVRDFQKLERQQAMHLVVLLVLSVV